MARFTLTSETMRLTWGVTLTWARRNPDWLTAAATLIREVRAAGLTEMVAIEMPWGVQLDARRPGFVSRDEGGRP